MAQEETGKRCPKCGGVMIKGYLHSHRGVWWKESKYSFASPYLGEGIQAWRCPMCNYLEFYVGD